VVWDFVNQSILISTLAPSLNNELTLGFGFRNDVIQLDSASYAVDNHFMVSELLCFQKVALKPVFIRWQMRVLNGAARQDAD
jgi:hypothetical protein